jgi:ribosomal protein S18 acetylase RimI-like enzyme
VSGRAERIQSYLRTSASRVRETERIGPFLATFDRESDNPFLSYAVPDDGAVPSPSEVGQLVSAYELHGRTPRLEYLNGAAPAVEPALLAGGFAVEARLALMICMPESLVDLPAPTGIELILPRSDEEVLGLVTAQGEAYGGFLSGPAEDTARMRRNLAAGAIALLARDAETGEAAGGGICSAPEDGITEIASVGVRAAFRRRGIAGAMVSRLTREAFEAGVTLPFLTPESDAEERIYARAGYVRVSEILHISRHRG